MFLQVYRSFRPGALWFFVLCVILSSTEWWCSSWSVTRVCICHQHGSTHTTASGSVTRFSHVMVDFSFCIVFLAIFLLKWAELVFFTRPWCVAVDIVVLVIVHTQSPCYTVDIHRVSDFVLPGHDVASAHADEAVRIQSSCYELCTSFRYETLI